MRYKLFMSAIIQKTAKVLAFTSFIASTCAFAYTYTRDPKFQIRSDHIVLTAGGYTFLENIAKKPVGGTIRKITKKEAYQWVDKFIKLSNRAAISRPDFTPINNLMNHLALCDELLANIYSPYSDNSPPLPAGDQIPKNRKEKLLNELVNLRKKLSADINELVAEQSRDDFTLIVDYYDRALRETLDI